MQSSSLGFMMLTGTDVALRLSSPGVLLSPFQETWQLAQPVKAHMDY